ncbi:MAG: 1,6-anhydro-N-acetylmuramyl-L-alanine amidase AmpD [Burkholderiaceae bacterium]
MTHLVDGWLREAMRMPSPNVDERPAGARVELIVIHNISLPPGTYGAGHVQALFTNRLEPGEHPFFAGIAAARVSAHLLIERNGRITQFASFDRRAWHAGMSKFQGRPRCNDFSVGIELEGSDFEPFTDAQYEALNTALRAVCAAYPVRFVCGHSDIAEERKTDPGPFFEWCRLALPASVSLRPARV